MTRNRQLLLLAAMLVVLAVQLATYASHNSQTFDESVHIWSGYFAWMAGSGSTRNILTDGRPLPVDAQPAWWGYSVGRWDPDAFVVETTGFKDMAWLDFIGHPATEALRITERFRRLDFGQMEVQLTFDDSKAYTRPWSVTVGFDLMPDAELSNMFARTNVHTND